MGIWSLSNIWYIQSQFWIVIKVKWNLSQLPSRVTPFISHCIQTLFLPLRLIWLAAFVPTATSRSWCSSTSCPSVATNPEPCSAFKLRLLWFAKSSSQIGRWRRQWLRLATLTLPPWAAQQQMKLKYVVS